MKYWTPWLQNPSTSEAHASIGENKDTGKSCWHVQSAFIIVVFLVERSELMNSWKLESFH